MLLPRPVLEKVERAKYHHRDLVNVCGRYFEDHAGEIVVDSTGDTHSLIDAPPIPWEVPHIVGDCIQNLRSSLDYLARELCVRSGNKPDKHTSFPICHTPECFTNEIARRAVALLDPQMIAEIEMAQPYHSGQSDLSNLWILHELCNINRHRRIFLTVLKVWDLPRAEGNATFPKMNVDREATVTIAFDEGVAKTASVLDFTKQMIAYVESVPLPSFDKFFL